MTKFVRTARIGATLFGACALVAVAAVPASAASEKSKRAESALTAEAGSVRVCVKFEAPTGTRIAPPRQCKTRDQWIKDTGVDPLATR
ncbi:hypothetical protein CA233_19950 [Sphingomonas sp. ABOLD]|uniref:Uncharacterized protein n=1 Tax=Sphingomonas trueperi TaxID=53317 RepID=A0A7X6BDH1_9SPHN|nr:MULTISPECIES: hypothetical protein [Sphingomonas]NJB97891.1 hypothetical protein [Sphingomonas trueperi]RSV40233.1 hypothetical protein CA233_19950 [Sphingomonas sp. ABOLD]RSV41485.1 hypothetical protein CA234_09415 [Sphingomonas sp. ABOLE]